MRRIVVLCLALAMAMPMLSGQKKKAAPQKKQYDVAAYLYPAYAAGEPRLKPFWPS